MAHLDNAPPEIFVRWSEGEPEFRVLTDVDEIQELENGGEFERYVCLRSLPVDAFEVAVDWFDTRGWIEEEEAADMVSPRASKAEWWFAYGQSAGYEDCCIRAFVADVMAGRIPRLLRPTNEDGCVLCAECAERHWVA